MYLPDGSSSYPNPLTFSQFPSQGPGSSYRFQSGIKQLRHNRTPSRSGDSVYINVEISLCVTLVNADHIWETELVLLFGRLSLCLFFKGKSGCCTHHTKFSFPNLCVYALPGKGLETPFNVLPKYILYKHIMYLMSSASICNVESCKGRDEKVCPNVWLVVSVFAVHLNLNLIDLLWNLHFFYY